MQGSELLVGVMVMKYSWFLQVGSLSQWKFLHHGQTVHQAEKGL